jgi:hypothetical protein
LVALSNSRADEGTVVEAFLWAGFIIIYPIGHVDVGRWMASGDQLQAKVTEPIMQKRHLPSTTAASRFTGGIFSGRRGRPDQRARFDCP